MKKFLVLVGEDTGCHPKQWYCVAAESKMNANEKIHKYYDEDVGWGIVEDGLRIWEEGVAISNFFLETPALNLDAVDISDKPVSVRPSKGVWRELDW